MQRNKIISIITVICFCTVIFIPIGLVLMWFSTEWKKKLKIILSSILGLLYIGLVVCLLFLEPSYNTSGLSLPGNYNQGQTAFEQTNSSKEKEKKDDKENPNTNKSKSDESENSKQQGNNFGGFKKASGGKKLGRGGFSLLFFLFMILLIIWQNLRAKKKSSYENPYVDTELYRLPFNEGSKFPIVHFLRLRTKPDEKILFATETSNKDDEGDFVVTTKRVVIYSLTENAELPLENLEAVTSVSNGVMQLTCGERKYYVFMHESQMKYAIAVVRWAYKNLTGVTGNF